MSGSLHIGILQADSVLPQFQAAHGNYPEMIERVFTAAAARLEVSLRFSTYDVEHGEYPSAPDACDGYVITGSKKSVYDDDPWIHVLADYVRLLDRQQLKLVGICFGHQLIAEALGGKTLSAEAGWGVGIHQSRVLERKWFMEPAMEDFSLLYSHKDQVVQLPEGAARLSGNEFCPFSMFSIGDHMLALQGHPEFQPDYAEGLMHMREDILGPEKFTAGIASLSSPLANVEVSVWILRFLRGRAA